MVTVYDPQQAIPLMNMGWGRCRQGSNLSPFLSISGRLFSISVPQFPHL